MKKVICLILVIALICTTGMSAFAVSAEDAAKDLGKYGIMGGFPDGTLRLQNYVTRAQTAKMVITALGRQDIYNDPYLVDFPSPFRDVTNKHWAFSCIVDAASCLLINGFNDRTFRPDENITCEQALKIIVCALNYDHYDYQVVDPSEVLVYPQSYIDIAQRIGLTDGLDFRVGQSATRGFIATVLSRALDVPIVESYVIEESKDPSKLWTKYGFQIMDGKNGNELKTLRRKLEGVVK